LVRCGERHSRTAHQLRRTALFIQDGEQQVGSIDTGMTKTGCHLCGFGVEGGFTERSSGGSSGVPFGAEALSDDCWIEAQATQNGGGNRATLKE
jgi:hypothetical protein